MSIFIDYAKIYDAIYKDKDYRTETIVLNKLLKNGGVKGKKICVFGCGTGGHDKYLRELGYTIHGIDISEKMIEIAREKAEGTYEVADIRNYCSKKKYDAIISPFHVMSYQNTNEDIKNAFISARRIQKDDGVFVFDTWYGPGVLTDLPEVRIKEVSMDEYQINRIAIPQMHANSNIVDVNYEIRIRHKKTKKEEFITESHHMRYFFKPEVEEFLNICGFELVDIFDGKTLLAPTYNTWSAYFVAKAI